MRGIIRIQVAMAIQTFIIPLHTFIKLNTVSPNRIFVESEKMPSLRMILSVDLLGLLACSKVVKLINHNNKSSLLRNSMISVYWAVGLLLISFL